MTDLNASKAQLRILANPRLRRIPGDGDFGSTSAENYRKADEEEKRN